MHPTPAPLALTRRFALPLGLLTLLALAGCVGTMSPTTSGLAPGLTARIDRPGATMDQSAALSIINHYRATRGTAALVGDAALTTQAAEVASQYARSGTPPARPEGTGAMRLSAGYETFADTFSGWRNSPADADALAMASARRAGLAVVYDANSAYGTHWVLLLAD